MRSKRTFCIGDIHGCAGTLERLLRQTIKLRKSDTLIFLGDYIDRGPDSKGVVDIILDLQQNKYEVTCLLGNHEDMFMESEHDDELFIHWFRRCGGFETLKSFNVNSFEALGDPYKYFFKSLLHYKTIDKKYIAVHAALNTNEKNIFADTYTMLWGRDVPIDRTKLNGRILLHGHTPQALSKTLEQLRQIKDQPVINLDTGCVFRNEPEYGLLSCLELESLILYPTENLDD